MAKERERVEQGIRELEEIERVKQRIRESEERMKQLRLGSPSEKKLDLPSAQNNARMQARITQIESAIAIHMLQEVTVSDSNNNQHPQTPTIESLSTNSSSSSRGDSLTKKRKSITMGIESEQSGQEKKGNVNLTNLTTFSFIVKENKDNNQNSNEQSQSANSSSSSESSSSSSTPAIRTTLS